MLTIPISNDESFQVLSTIARVSGGRYDELPNLLSNWKTFQGPFARLNNPRSAAQEFEIAKTYLSPMLLCGKPESVDIRRWFIKSLSNDQTAFAGFTSLVDIVNSNTFGYDGPIRLVPSATFIEPFAFQQLQYVNQMKLQNIQEQLIQLDSTKIEEMNFLLAEANRICPVDTGRKKGKSPLFFYSVSDKPFQLSQLLYDRLVNNAKQAYDALCAATGDQGRNILTGSVDFMIYGKDIYLIDIGTPAVGYIADIAATSVVLGRKANFGIEKIATTLNGSITVPNSALTEELGFFKQERDILVTQLKECGITVIENYSDRFEAMVNGEELPTPAFDYLSRNQPLRNLILSGWNGQGIGCQLPKGSVIIPNDFTLARFYDSTKLGQEEYGLLIKKKVLFKEYERGSNYFKPLVTPIWGRELWKDKKSTLFEQFVPSLIDTDIMGDTKGKRCYEIRLYFVGGAVK